MTSPIPITREKLTLMGVPFPDLAMLDSTANAIGLDMMLEGKNRACHRLCNTVYWFCYEKAAIMGKL